jgi:hypothetical protein
VQLPATAGETKATLSLLDAIGRSVRSYSVALASTETHHDLDLTNLLPGVYALRLTARSGSVVRRLVVE